MRARDDLGPQLQVTFTCNACGDSVKKNKVISHYQTQCRNCTVLSCIDCGKDFAGDAYLEHNSCISEAQKYQGHLYREKPGQNKGEVKQQAWLDVVRQAAEAAGPRLKAAMSKARSLTLFWSHSTA
jgi:cell growth-regulating nucleolar protein